MGTGSRVHVSSKVKKGSSDLRITEYQLTQGRTDKFWRVFYTPSWSACQWGRRGTDGQFQFAGVDVLRSRETEKYYKGYTETLQAYGKAPGGAPKNSEECTSIFLNLMTVTLQEYITTYNSGSNHLVVISGYQQERNANQWLSILDTRGYHHAGTDRYVGLLENGLASIIGGATSGYSSLGPVEPDFTLNKDLALGAAVLWDPGCGGPFESIIGAVQAARLLNA
jgi:predicted DNA-binding WGR domain protein